MLNKIKYDYKKIILLLIYMIFVVFISQQMRTNSLIDLSIIGVITIVYYYINSKLS